VDTILALPLFGLLALSLVMAGAWARQRKTGNAGLVDPLWAAGLGLLAVFYAVATEGWGPRRALVAVLAASWSARLTLHLARRVAGEREDGRYAILRERWGARFQTRLLWFFQAQALLAGLLSLAFLALCAADEAGWRAVDALGLLLWLASVGGESLADRQLRAWRADPAHRGKTCRSGLWAWSRHPNYFFEWVHWLVYPVLGLGLPWGPALWLAPALMLLLVLKVTGIPPTEEQSLRSRGDDYRAYQRTTNAFFPGPPRRVSGPSPQTS
jgi:steroid 5-alpha reductase family enzyme